MQGYAGRPYQGGMAGWPAGASPQQVHTTMLECCIMKNLCLSLESCLARSRFHRHLETACPFFLDPLCSAVTLVMRVTWM